MRPDLTDEEVDSICAGLKQHEAKARYMRRMGVTVRKRPNGRPLVMRAEFERIMTGATSAPANSGPKWKVL